MTIAFKDPETPAPAPPPAGAVEEAIAVACGRISPLWPLKHFVAVNPFLGFAGTSFAETAATFRRVAGVDMLMPRRFYREAIDTDFIHDVDLAQALDEADFSAPGVPDVAALREAAAKPTLGATPRAGAVATVAEVLDKLADGDRQASRTAFMIDEISKFCAAYFDQGQSVWRLPFRDRGFYQAWRAAMRYDLNPGAMGVKDFRKAVAAASADPRQAIVDIVRALGIPDRAVADYLHRALLDIGGWAAYARYLGWNRELYGETDETLVDLLAVRVVWGYALFLERSDVEFTLAWKRAMAEAAEAPSQALGRQNPDLAIDLALHDAYERAFQRRWIARLASPRAGNAAADRPAVQAAFCIDVRSEVFRRALETVCPTTETIGFAGFFGFPIEYVPLGARRGGAQCPVLLKPSVIVCEAVADADENEEQTVLTLRLLRRRVSKAWKAFKLSAISCFAFVETAGLLYLVKLASDALGATRPVVDPREDGFDSSTLARLAPRLDPRELDGRPTGFTVESRIAMAEATLRAMSMTSTFAPLVLLAGHGSTTANNAHATSLDCGACGGHTGEANARVAAAVLNDLEVRVGLKARGIAIPDDTWFLAALHDTTTDEVRLFEADKAPASHKKAIEELRQALVRAGALTRAERAPALGVDGEKPDARVLARSRDWSQVRPEWGLAGNAAFIAAPRGVTRSLDLDGRAFLHTYDWTVDEGFRTLDLILTAPMVVASWINLQYFGSTVNNRVFGAGNKVLHNVVGTLGVLEGNAGDLRVGLPWQSVHDGRRFVHDPVRLSVFVAAPLEALANAIRRHGSVRNLLDNGWVHLFALDGHGRAAHRYRRGGTWDALT